jgi:hypothetical protein
MISFRLASSLTGDYFLAESLLCPRRRRIGQRVPRCRAKSHIVQQFLLHLITIPHIEGTVASGSAAIFNSGCVSSVFAMAFGVPFPPSLAFFFARL